MIKDDMGIPKIVYKYDPWGNVTGSYVCNLSVSSNSDGEEIGEINPFRYRGYYYDTETGLYYLMTRYYDPREGLFISPDSVQYLKPETIGGIDLYAYRQIKK